MARDLVQASAAFAVARIRLVRRDRWRTRLGEAAGAWAVLLGVSIPFGLLFLFGDEKIPAGWRVPVLLLALLFAPALPLLFAFAGKALLEILGQMLTLPSLAFALVVWRHERAAERLLLEHGRIPIEWFDGRRLRRQAVDRLLAYDPELVLEHGAIRPIGAAPVSCPTCGAGLVQVGPGLRQCGHCAYGRHDPLPSPSPAWRARRIDPEPLEARLRARHPWLSTWFPRALMATGASLVLGALGELLFPPGHPAFGLLMGAAMLIALPGVIGLGYGLRQIGTFYLAEWPKLRGQRSQLREEVLRLVHERGAVSLPALADCLAVPLARLEPAVLAMLASGDLPLYHDRTRHRVISRFCQGTDSRCPACGGEAAPGPEGLKCGACETLVLALSRSGASPADAAPVGAANPGAAPAGAAPAGPPGGGAGIGPAPVESAPDLPPPTEPELRIDLESARVEASGTLRGRIRLRLPEVRRCDQVELELQRHLKGDREAFDERVWIDRKRLLAHREVIGPVEEPFELSIPPDAFSWSGRLVTVEWRVYARLMPDQLAWSRGIEIGPGRADPETDATLLRRWREAGRAEVAGEMFTTMLLWSLIVLPCTAVWLAMVVGGIVFLPREPAKSMALLAFAGLAGIGAWQGVSDLVKRRIAALLMGATAEPPAVLHPGDRVQVPVTLRGWPVRARWELSQGQHAGRIERRKTRNGTTQSTRWTSSFFWYAKGDLQPVGGLQHIVLEVPDDLPGTVKGELREIRWSFDIRLERGPFTRTVSVPVLVVPGRLTDAPKA